MPSRKWHVSFAKARENLSSFPSSSVIDAGSNRISQKWLLSMPRHESTITLQMTLCVAMTTAPGCPVPIFSMHSRTLLRTSPSVSPSSTFSLCGELLQTAMSSGKSSSTSLSGFPSHIPKLMSVSCSTASTCTPVMRATACAVCIALDSGLERTMSSDFPVK